MVFSEHSTTFGGKPVEEYEFGQSIEPDKYAYRIFTEYEDEHPIAERFQQFLADPRASETEALLIGAWFEADDMSDSPDELIEMLISAADQLVNLRALFFGDVIFEECEVSWIQQGDLSAIWEAYPRLEEFWVRGSAGLNLGTIVHDNLRKFVMQSGGLSQQVTQQIANAKLPNLEHLEVYFGDDGYGWDGTIEDIQQYLDAAKFPNLKYLGLKNCTDQDAIVEAVCTSNVLNELQHLETLDFAGGTLSDTGAEHLLNCEAIKKLKKLDLHHHFMSDEMANRVSQLPPDVDVSEGNGPDEDYRYCAVGE